LSLPFPFCSVLGCYVHAFVIQTTHSRSFVSTSARPIRRHKSLSLRFTSSLRRSHWQPIQHDLNSSPSRGQLRKIGHHAQSHGHYEGTTKPPGTGILRSPHGGACEKEYLASNVGHATLYARNQSQRKFSVCGRIGVRRK